jgi:ornithine carbamoyltransferase
MLQFKTKHFLTGEELSQKELLQLLDTAEALRLTRGREQKILNDKTIALIFEKPSLRTRVSFSVGISELGGRVIEIQGAQKKNEDPEDAIRVLQGMVHGVMIRTFEHSYLERMITHATMPVMNGLSDTHHPCQALADILTLKQKFGELRGLKLAYIGDGNNILHSLLLMAPYVGIDVHYACPEGYQPDQEIVGRAHLRAHLGGAKIKKFNTPSDAVDSVHAIYTDVWTSMGFEKENEVRMKAFAGYQINSELFSRASKRAIVMHCLPMIKGQEITLEMAEHEQSALFQQAENRLHAQKALLFGLFSGVNTNISLGIESDLQQQEVQSGVFTTRLRL